MKIPKTRIRVYTENGNTYYYPEYQVKGLVFSHWEGLVIQYGRTTCYSDIKDAKEAVDNYLAALSRGVDTTKPVVEIIEYP